MSDYSDNDRAVANAIYGMSPGPVFGGLFGSLMLIWYGIVFCWWILVICWKLIVLTWSLCVWLFELLIWAAVKCWNIGLTIWVLATFVCTVPFHESEAIEQLKTDLDREEVRSTISLATYSALLIVCLVNGPNILYGVGTRLAV